MAGIRDKSFWMDLIKRILQKVLKKYARKSNPSTRNQHVVPHPDGWAVRGEGNERYSGTYTYQDDAITRAKTIAKNYSSDVVIHRKDGTIRDRVTPR